MIFSAVLSISLLQICGLVSLHYFRHKSCIVPPVLYFWVLIEFMESWKSALLKNTLQNFAKNRLTSDRRSKNRKCMSAELGGLFSKRKLYWLNIVKLPEQISFFRIYNTTARVFLKSCIVAKNVVQNLKFLPWYWFFRTKCVHQSSPLTETVNVTNRPQDSAVNSLFCMFLEDIWSCWKCFVRAKVPAFYIT